MKISRSSQTISEILALLLSGLFAFVMAFLIERMFWGYRDTYSFALNCWPVLLCHLVGRLASKLRKKGPRTVLAAVMAAASVLLVFLLTRPQGALPIIACVLTALPAALIYIIALSCVPVYPQPLAVTSVCLYLFAIVFCAVRYNMADPASPLCICAMADFMLCLYSANVKGMYDGLHVREKHGVNPTASMRSGNTLLLSGFVVISLLVAMTGIVQSGLGFVFTKVISAVFAVLNFFASLETGDDGPMPTPTPTPDPEAEHLSALDAPPMGIGTYLLLGMFVLLGIVFIIGLYMAYAATAPDRKARRTRKKAAEQDYEDFWDDEVESVFDMDDFKARSRDSLAALRRRLRRAVKFSDMPDDTARVRFAYKSLMASPLGEDRACSTPLEVSRQMSGDSLSRLAEDYSAVRYGETAADSAAGQNAASAMRVIARAKQKK